MEKLVGWSVGSARSDFRWWGWGRVGINHSAGRELSGVAGKLPLTAHAIQQVTTSKEGNRITYDGWVRGGMVGGWHLVEALFHRGGLGWSGTAFWW